MGTTVGFSTTGARFHSEGIYFFGEYSENNTVGHKANTVRYGIPLKIRFTIPPLNSSGRISVLNFFVKYIFRHLPRMRYAKLGKSEKMAKFQ